MPIPSESLSDYRETSSCSLPLLAPLCICAFIHFEREEKGGGRAGGKHPVKEKHPSVVSCRHPNQRPNAKSWHVPGKGIEPATFHFAGRGPTN